jgi:hypothetical protein
MTTDIFCFYLQNRLIQTSQTGGLWQSATLVFPGLSIKTLFALLTLGARKHRTVCLVDRLRHTYKEAGSIGLFVCPGNTKGGGSLYH